MALSTYTAVEGQSLYDICLNTYGSLDFLRKMILDSSVESIDVAPYSGQVFYFDPELVVDQAVNRQLAVTNTRYATAYSKLGSVFYTIKEGGINTQPTNNYNPPPDPNKTTTMYEQVGNYQYTAGADGESTINLPDLIGKDLVQIEKEIMPLKNNQWLWNKNSGQLTLQNGGQMSQGETLFILWSQMIITTT